MKNSDSSNLHRRIMLAWGKGPVRLFRNNVAMAWAGKLIRKMPDGLVVLGNARPLHAGLCVGSSDLIGWKSITVTPDMVGQKLAVFVGLEAKTGSGTLEPEQRDFILAVMEAGGISGEARSVEQAGIILEGTKLWKPGQT